MLIFWFEEKLVICLGWSFLRILSSKSYDLQVIMKYKY